MTSFEENSELDSGFPEPAVYTFGALASYRKILEPQEVIAGAKRTMVDLWKNKVTYIAFPTFHVCSNDPPPKDIID